MKRLLGLLGLAVLVVAVMSPAGQGAPARVITFFTPETDPTSVAIDEEIIARFQRANPGVIVNVLRGGFDDLLPRLPALVRSGTAPDVAFFGPRYVAGLAAQGLLLPLDDLFAELGDIPKSFVAPSPDGRIYDIPAIMESEVLYYRRSLFREAGLVPPETFEEWLQAARRLTVDRNGDRRPDQWGISIQGASPENAVRFASVLWSNGADYFDEQNNVAIDSPAAIQALEFWGELAKYAPPGVTSAGNFDTAVDFAQGLTAMIKYPGRLLTIIDRYNPQLSGDVAVAVPPVGPSGSRPVVWTPINDFIVFASTKHPDLAKAFVKFYLEEQQYLLLLTRAVPGHMLPVRTSYLDNAMYFGAPEIARWAQLIEESLQIGFKYGVDFHTRHPGVVNPYLGQAIGGPTWTRILNAFLAGQMSAEQAMKSVARSWREEFGIR